MLMDHRYLLYDDNMSIDSRQSSRESDITKRKIIRIRRSLASLIAFPDKMKN